MSDQARVDILSTEPYAWREVHTAPGPGCVSPLRSLAPDFSSWPSLSILNRAVRTRWAPDETVSVARVFPIADGGRPACR